MNDLAKTFALAPILIAARDRTGNKKLGHRVEQGKFQLVQVNYKKGGASDVIEIGPWLGYDDYVCFLSEYK